MKYLLRALQLHQIKPRLAGLKLLILDVDGVLTDGGLWFSADGELQKRFDVRDGLGIKLLQQAGMTIAFLSGGSGGATEVRAKQLGISYCLVGIKDKPRALAQLQNDLRIGQQHTGFIGDDLNDLAVKKQINLLITPADACTAVRRQADWVLSRNGGQGAVREAAEAILKSRGAWKSLRHNGWQERND